MQIKSRLDRQYLKADNALLLQLDPFVNSIFPAGILVSLVGFLVVYFSEYALQVFMYWDLVIAVICLAIYGLKNKIKTKYKLFIIIAILQSYGMTAFKISGIFGIGIFLMITACILSLAFLSVRVSILLLTLSLFQCIYVYREVVMGVERYVETSYNKEFIGVAYCLIYIGVTIVGISTYISIKAIKKRLYDNINVLNKQVGKVNEKNEMLKHKNEKIKYLAYYDQLTTLPNRTLFYKQVNAQLANKENGVLILVDIIKFHKINSFYGTKKGDELLRQMGVFLKKELLKTNTFGYMGSNMVGIWIDYEISEEEIRLFFSEYRKAMQAQVNIPFELDAYLVAVASNEKTKNFDDIFKIADKAMKHIKRSDKKSMIFFNEDTYSQLKIIEDKESMIENAIHKKLYNIHYQEKVNVETGQVVGLEALARLNYGDENIPPNIFIPVIEENRWTIAFGKVILEKVFREFPRLISIYGEDIVVSINVSPQQLTDQYFITDIRELLDQYYIKPSQVEFEITENILMTNLEDVVLLFRRIKSLGVRISIDDFGTGYSSLKYIAELPIDVIKIDKSFIDKIVTDEKTRAIVAAIVNIAHVTHIKVVAEGVEEEEQVDVLKVLECYIVQGFLYSKPKEIELCKV